MFNVIISLQIVEAVKPTVCDDTEEGVSVRTLVKHLQRFKVSFLIDFQVVYVNITIQRCLRVP